MARRTHAAICTMPKLDRVEDLPEALVMDREVGEDVSVGLGVGHHLQGDNNHQPDAGMRVLCENVCSVPMS